MELTVIYPAYNEAKNLRETIARSVVELRKQFRSFEVLIVDDCGRDGTGALADELASDHPEIRVIHNPENVGQGMSIRKGFAEARGELVIHNAVDYPFDLRDLPVLLAAISCADIVVAVRTRRPGYSPYRLLLSIVNRKLLRLLFPLDLKDCNFVQLFRKSVLASLPVDARSTGFLIPELLVRAHDAGYRIRSVEVEYHPRTRGKATSGSFKVLAATAMDMARFWLKRKRMAKPAARRIESRAEEL